MFKVPTFLAPSPIHGIGVYTAVAIPAGSVVWEFDPPVDWEIPPDEMASIPEPYQTRLRHFSYLDESGVYVLCGDNAKFMNHSPEPNCDDTGASTVAARDIEAGEELTCDYRAFDVESREEGIVGDGGDHGRLRGRCGGPWPGWARKRAGDGSGSTRGGGALPPPRSVSPA